jgi:hypothetical protein
MLGLGVSICRGLYCRLRLSTSPNQTQAFDIGKWSDRLCPSQWESSWSSERLCIGDIEGEKEILSPPALFKIALRQGRIWGGCIEKDIMMQRADIRPATRTGPYKSIEKEKNYFCRSNRISSSLNNVVWNTHTFVVIWDRLLLIADWLTSLLQHADLDKAAFVEQECANETVCRPRNQGHRMNDCVTQTLNRGCLPNIKWFIHFEQKAETWRRLRKFYIPWRRAKLWSRCRAIRHFDTCLTDQWDLSQYSTTDWLRMPAASTLNCLLFGRQSDQGGDSPWLALPGPRLSAGISCASWKLEPVLKTSALLRTLSQK